MERFIGTLFVIATIFAAGCGGGGESASSPPPPVVPMSNSALAAVSLVTGETSTFITGVEPTGAAMAPTVMPTMVTGDSDGMAIVEVDAPPSITDIYVAVDNDTGYYDINLAAQTRHRQVIVADVNQFFQVLLETDAAKFTSPLTLRIVVKDDGAFSKPATVTFSPSQQTIPDQAGLITLNSPPTAVGVDPAGHRAYIASDNSADISVVDTTANTIMQNIATGAVLSSDINGITVDQATGDVYFVSPVNGVVGVVARGGATPLITAALPTGPTDVAVDEIAHKIYVSSRATGAVTVLNAAGLTIAATIPVGDMPGPIAVDAVTHRAYVLAQDPVNNAPTLFVLDGTTNTVMGKAAIGPPPGDLPGAVGTGVGVDPGGRVYVSNGMNSVLAFDPANLGTPSTLTVGSGPHGIAVDAVRHLIYVANTGDNTASIIDGATVSVQPGTIALGSQPTGIAINALSGLLYVANTDAQTVSVVGVSAASRKRVPRSGA